jgi:hypothetical protein
MVTDPTTLAILGVGLILLGTALVLTAAEIRNRADDGDQAPTDERETDGD